MAFLTYSYSVSLGNNGASDSNIQRGEALQEDRRQWSRRIVPEPELGLISVKAGIGPEYGVPGNGFKPLFVGIHNLSPGGLLLESPVKLKQNSKHLLTLYDFSQKKWRTHLGKLVWTRGCSRSNKNLSGIQFIEAKSSGKASKALTGSPPADLLAHLESLLETELLLSIPRHAIWSLLNCLVPLSFKKGDEFIAQGEKGDSLYIIRQGTCIVQVVKEGVSHPVAHLAAGDVVGEMAVLTGEPRYAAVIAETDLQVWKLEKSQFEAVSAEYSDLRMFLTELLTRRLETSGFTADRTIGRYLIKMKIQHGGWGIVYQAVHKTLNMTVAIKMLKHKMAMDHDFQEKFRQEASIIASLNHANIVHIHDIEELYQTIFIIMEYLEGDSLENILKRVGVIPPEKTVDYIIQVCRGLSYAHKQGIIHQDIKPGNLFVQHDGQVKILDFGLACAPGVDDLSMLGTVYYASPEQIDGNKVDARTDIYCLGITAFEMVVGQRPYPEDDLMNLMDLHLEKDIPDPATLVPNLPDGLRRFIIRACRRNPAERYQSMDEALKDLNTLYRQLSICSTADEPERKRRMASLFLFYQDHQLGAVNRLLDEFSNKAQEMGLTIKAADFKDI